jgi:hypothetical protein
MIANATELTVVRAAFLSTMGHAARVFSVPIKQVARHLNFPA